jgi:hypothetical protein
MACNNISNDKQRLLHMRHMSALHGGCGRHCRLMLPRVYIGLVA